MEEAVAESAKVVVVPPDFDVSAMTQRQLSDFLEEHEQVSVSANGSKHTTTQIPVALLCTSFESNLNKLVIRYMDTEHTEDLASGLESGWLKGNSLLARERRVECDEEKFNEVGKLYGKNFTGTSGATIYFYLVYDVFDGSHRKTAISLNVERERGGWTLCSEVPVTVHHSTLPDNAAIRYAGFVNELQAVAKASSYSDQLIFLFKNLLKAVAILPAAEVPPLLLSADGKKETQADKKKKIAEIKAFKKKQRQQVETYVLEYFRVAVRHSKNFMSAQEQQQFSESFDLTYVKAKLFLAEFLREDGLNAISSLERTPLRKASPCWSEMVPTSQFHLGELGVGERASLFPNTVNAVKKLNTKVIALVGVGHALFKEAAPTLSAVEVSDLPQDIRTKIGLRLVCWHTAFYAQKVWRRRDVSAPAMNQLVAAQHLSRMYLEVLDNSKEEDAVTQAMQCFWNDIAFLSQLQNQYYEAHPQEKAKVLQDVLNLNQLVGVNVMPAQESKLNSLFLVRIELYKLPRVMHFLIFIVAGPALRWAHFECVKTAVHQVRSGLLYICLCEMFRHTKKRLSTRLTDDFI